MLGCLTQIWVKYGQTPSVGLKMQLKNVHLKVKVEVGLKCEIRFLTQHLGLSIFDPNLGSNNPALFRECILQYDTWLFE